MATTCIAVALTTWLCALIAVPRKPLPGHETAELVYARLLGRQRWLALLAAGATVFMAFTLLLAHLPQDARPQPFMPAAPLSLRAEREQVPPTCPAPPAGGVPTCYELQPGGTWLVVRQQGDGTWRGVATVVTLPAR